MPLRIIKKNAIVKPPEFKDLPTNTLFELNGNLYLKINDGRSVQDIALSLSSGATVSISPEHIVFEVEQIVYTLKDYRE